MTVLRFDNRPVKGAKRLDNGWLRAPAHLTRVGVFDYRLGDGRVRRELRPADEVFKADSLESFDGVPLTDNHPTAGLDGKNATQLTVGTVGKVRRDGNLVAAEVLIIDGNVAAKVESGKRELSCGYYCDTDETPGVWVDDAGKSHPYDAIQRNIRGNHVAIVARGRAGPEARVRLDSADGEAVNTDGEAVTEREEPPMSGTKKIKLDGVEVELPETVAQLVDRHAEAQTAKTAAVQVKLDQATARADAADEKVKGLEGKLAEAGDSKRFDAAVTARVALLGQAQGVLGADFKADGLSDRDVKVKVLEKCVAGFKADGKSDAYVDARFDAAIEAQATVNPATAAAAAALAGKTGEGAPAVTRTDTRSAQERHDAEVYRDRSAPAKS